MLMAQMLKDPAGSQDISIEHRLVQSYHLHDYHSWMAKKDLEASMQPQLCSKIFPAYVQQRAGAWRIVTNKMLSFVREP